MIVGGENMPNNSCINYATMIQLAPTTMCVYCCVCVSMCVCVCVCVYVTTRSLIELVIPAGCSVPGLVHSMCVKLVI